MFSNLLISLLPAEQNNLDGNSPDSVSKLPLSPSPLPSFFFFFRRSTFLSGFCWRMLCSCGYKLPFSPYHLDIWTPKPRFKAWHRFSPLGVHRVFSSSSFLFVGPVFFFSEKNPVFQAFFCRDLFWCF